MQDLQFLFSRRVWENREWLMKWRGRSLSYLSVFLKETVCTFSIPSGLSLHSFAAYPPRDSAAVNFFSISDNNQGMMHMRAQAYLTSLFTESSRTIEDIGKGNLFLRLELLYLRPDNASSKRGHHRNGTFRILGGTVSGFDD